MTIRAITFCAGIVKAALGAALAFCATVQAQEEARPASSEVQDLYNNALQSIAEGRKNDASATLMQVIEKESLHAGAYLEVALIQCSLGRAVEAERLFAIVETRFDPPPAILELITEARMTGCDTWKPQRFGSVSVGRGFDRNVNQGASKPSYIVERDGGSVELPLLADFLPQHDQYTATGVDYTQELTPNGTVGFVQFLGRRNDTLSQYDSSSLFLGIDTPYRFGRWTLRTSAMFGVTGFGGDYYQRQLQLQARLGPPLPLPNHTQFHISTGVTRNEYLTLANFNANTFELRGQYTYNNGGVYASASHALLDDRASGDRPGGNRHGFSTNLSARRQLSDKVRGELSYTHQTWRSANIYAPGLIMQVRKQSTDVVRAAVIYPILKNQSIQLEGRLIRNRENISIFQYNNRVLQLSWQLSAP